MPGVQPSGRMAGRIVAHIGAEVADTFVDIAPAGVGIGAALADTGVVVVVVWAAALARGVALGPAPSEWY